MQSRTRLGEILVDRGLLTDQQLAMALDEQRRRQGGEPLGQVLVRMGLLDAEQLTNALTEQTRRWVAAGITAGILALQPSLLAARTVSAQLSVSVEVLATASVAVKAAASPAAGPANHVSVGCGGEPVMRVTYQRALIVPQSATVSASPYVPAAPAYKLNLQPVSQSLVPCSTVPGATTVAPSPGPLTGDAMNVEIAY
jgi:hypothetical protein